MTRANLLVGLRYRRLSSITPVCAATDGVEELVTTTNIPRDSLATTVFVPLER